MNSDGRLNRLVTGLDVLSSPMAADGATADLLTSVPGHRRSVAFRRLDGQTFDVEIHDSFVPGPDGSCQRSIRWEAEHDEQWVARGSGAEIFRDGRKVMELSWDSSAPVRITCHDCRPTDSLPGSADSSGCGDSAQIEPASGAGLSDRSTACQGLDVAAVTSGPWEITTRITTTDFLYRDWGLAPCAPGWYQHRAEVPVNYHLEEVEGADSLILVFSALGPRGSFTYNYKRSLDPIPAHKMYILDDFGDQGSYFHSHYGELTIQRSVLETIRGEINRLGIDSRRICAVGTSKGGSAALIFGAQLGLGHVVIGAPQIKIGSFLATPHPNILKFMTGGNSSEDIAWADRIVPDHAKQLSSETSVTLLIGTRDHHYRDHLPTLMDAFESVGYGRYDVLPLEGVDHAGIGARFRQEAPGHICHALELVPTREFQLRGWSFLVRSVGDRTVLELTSPRDGSAAAVYVHRNGTAVEKYGYDHKDRKLEFPAMPGQECRLRLFVKKGPDREVISTPDITGLGTTGGHSKDILDGVRRSC